jgi:hypothetical protein
MNRRVVLPVLLLSAVFGSAAFGAGVCMTDTLANYEGLPAGCTIKALNFGSFTFTTVFATGGAVPVTADQITVTPVDPSLIAGLNFSSSGFSVSPGQSVEYQISHVVRDPPIIHGMHLRLVDPVTFPAIITITSEECLGAAFAGTTCPTLSTVTNTVFDNGITAVLDDTKFFPPIHIIGELTTIKLDASPGGSASFSSFQEDYLLTPEPWSAALVVSGMALLVLARLLQGRFLSKARKVLFDLGAFRTRA